MQTTKFLVGYGIAAVALAGALQTFAGPDNDAQSKMREALRQKIETLNTESTPAPTPAPAAKAETPKPTTVVPVPAEIEPYQPAPAAATAAVAATKSDSKFSAVPEANEDATAAKMREAMRQKIAADPAVAPAATATAVSTKPFAAPAPAPAVTSMVASPVRTEPAIASAFSSSKQDRLAVLLQQYRADQISPQQYHTQRAKIIAEP